jgi:hypothetical protein
MGSDMMNTCVCHYSEIARNVLKTDYLLGVANLCGATFERDGVHHSCSQHKHHDGPHSAVECEGLVL